MAILFGVLLGMSVCIFAFAIYRACACSHRPEPAASTTCVWCEAPLRGHDDDTECPVAFDESGRTHASASRPYFIHYFKPMTVEQWLKYCGITNEDEA